MVIRNYLTMSHVEQIKEKLSIADVVEAYIKIDKAGANYKALCPFHHEKTASFFISPSRNSFYCFGCGIKGDIFSFVQEFEGLDFKGSLKILAEKAGVKLDFENFKTNDDTDRLYSCLHSAATYFEDNLHKKPENKEIVEYLYARGLTDETIKEWGIGYALLDWHSAHLFLKSKKFSDLEIEKVGIIKKAEESAEKTRYYDRFRGRIMFPISDSGGRVVGFSGRIVKDDEKSAKYLNSPETELFHKSSVLFGLHKAKPAIREKDETVLVEGQMDIILAHQVGSKNVVALSGTALTEDHVELLHRFSNRIILAFDPDRAGVNATRRSAILALKGGMEVKVASLPKGKDPADLILKESEQWLKILSQAMHIIHFSLEKIVSSGASGKKLIEEIAENVFPFIFPLQSSMEKSYYLRDISLKTGIGEEAVVSDYKKAEKKYEDELGNIKFTEGKVSESSQRKTHRYIIEKRIYGIILWQENAVKPILDSRKITERLIHIIKENNFQNIVNIFLPSKSELALEAEVLYGSLNTEEDLDELFIHLEQDYIKAELSYEIEKLAAAERKNDKVEGAEILKKCKELSERLSAIKKK